MAAQPNQVSLFQAQIAKYWQPTAKASFPAWGKRIDECAKKIEELKLRAIANLQEPFKAPLKERDITPVLDIEKDRFRQVLIEIRNIEEEMAPANQLSREAREIARTDKTSSLLGDYATFNKRLDDLKADISKIYKDSLYPFFLVLQNAESGWNPSTLICTVWDYWSRKRVVDPKEEIFTAYPINLVTR